MRVVVLLAVMMTALAMSQNRLNPCQPGFSPPNWNAFRRELAQHQQLWQRKGVPSYRYTFRTASWMPNRVIEVRVERGRVVSAVEQGVGPLSPQQRQEWSIPKLLEQIALEAQTPRPCETISVVYNPVYGFPKSYNWSSYAIGISDGHSGYQITDFVVLR